MILTQLDITAGQFELGTGWSAKPEGLCRGDSCVPFGTHGAAFSLNAAAETLGMPLVHDALHGLWALGPETLSGRALTNVQAQELVLPDLSGAPFRLSSLLGRKVVLVAWAPY